MDTQRGAQQDDPVMAPAPRTTGRWAVRGALAVITIFLLFVVLAVVLPPDWRNALG